MMADQTTILVAEDDIASRRIMVKLLERSGYNVLAANDGVEAAQMMSSEVGLAVLDWMMPGLDGLALCRLTKSSPETADTYVLMVTAKTEKSDMVAALDAGADDYMTKPVDHDELLARVRAAERIAEREHSLRSAYRKVRSAAKRDALTGLYNRGQFDRVLVEEIERSAATGDALCLLMFDLDHFKLVNDIHGHHVGDLVLKEVAAVLSEQVREGADTVARYGGEELAIIAPSTSPLCGMQLAERIRKKVALLRIPAEGQLVSVTISVGLGAYNDHIGGSPDPVTALIEEADMRLFQAKHAGRNRVAA